METPYRAVTFNKHDIITKASMDQLQSNYQWIKDNTPRGQFNREGQPPLEIGTVMVGGRARINRARKRDTETVRVQFGAKAFAASCRPVVTTGVVADFQRQIFCVVHGLKKTNQPSAAGFEITVNVAAVNEKNDVIKKDFLVHWHAFGYREPVTANV